MPLADIYLVTLRQS